LAPRKGHKETNVSLITIESTETGVRWTTDGLVIKTAIALRACLEQLGEPSAVVCEPAFFEGLRDVRQYLDELVSEYGHTLVSLTSGARKVLELAGGSAIRGTGVARLHALATLGSAGLDHGVTDVAGIWEVRDALDVALAADQFFGATEAKARALAAAGPYAALDPATRLAVCDGEDYRWDVLLAAYRAGSVSGNRDDYERLLGLTAGAHGALARTINAWYVERNTNDLFERESVMTWSDYRHALRSLFHNVKKAQIKAKKRAS
jgi:hypothetical protein